MPKKRDTTKNQKNIGNPIRRFAEITVRVHCWGVLIIMVVAFGGGGGIGISMYSGATIYGKCHKHTPESKIHPESNDASHMRTKPGMLAIQERRRHLGNNAYLTT